MLKWLLLINILLFSCQGTEPPPLSQQYDLEESAPELTIDYPDRFLISDAIQLKINKYESVVKKYAKRYGFDWRLIMALIRQESKFRENARSRVGARGLMQIMPGTAADLTNELDIQYISQNPRENIAAGIYHLYKQYKKLNGIDNKDERLKMSLAAYNGGFGRVRDGRKLAKLIFRDDQSWEALANALPMLEPKYWKVHLQVWQDGRPPHGYFKGSDETVTYVDNIFNYYKIYRRFY